MARKQVFYYLLIDYVLDNGFNPTPKQLAHDLKINISSVYKYLNELEKEGKIKRFKNGYIDVRSDKE